MTNSSILEYTLIVNEEEAGLTESEYRDTLFNASRELWQRENEPEQMNLYIVEPLGNPRNFAEVMANPVTIQTMNMFIFQSGAMPNGNRIYTFRLTNLPEDDNTPPRFGQLLESRKHTSQRYYNN